MRYAPKLLPLTPFERTTRALDYRVCVNAEAAHAEIRDMARKAREKYGPDERERAQELARERMLEYMRAQQNVYSQQQWIGTAAASQQANALVLAQQQQGSMCNFGYPPPWSLFRAMLG